LNLTLPIRHSPIYLLLLNRNPDIMEISFPSLNRREGCSSASGDKINLSLEDEKDYPKEEQDLHPVRNDAPLLPPG
jgi:hypothetical protein